MEITDKSVLTALKAVFSSERAMPAHFSSDEERSKSFFIDYDMDADDEYEIASQTFHILWEYLGKIPEDQISKSDASAVLKVGEDLAIGAFILQRTDEYASFSDMQQEIVEENLRMWDQPRLNEVMTIPLVRNYLDFCLWFGRARANGFRWGKEPSNWKNNKS